MLKAVVAQASITKGFEREEPWYDHGDFTVLCGFGFSSMGQLIVLMDMSKSRFEIGGFAVCFGRALGYLCVNVVLKSKICI